MRYTYLIILAFTTTSSFSQGVSYGDLYEYSSVYFSKSPGDTIDCDVFFEIYDIAMTLRGFDIQECSPNGPINRKEIYPLITQYPEEAKNYRISGNALIDFLIDKDGNLVCYRIRTELGNAFIKQIEKYLMDYEFEKFLCKQKSYAYVTLIGFRYEYKQKYKKNVP